MTKTVVKLKEIIDKNGPNYPTDEPYQVYNELIGSKVANRKTAGAILCYLVSSIANENGAHSDLTGLSKIIQKECSFNKKMADQLAEIFLSL